MVVPQHYDLAAYSFQEEAQECKNLFTTQVLPVQSSNQVNAAASRRGDQRSNRVYPVMVRYLRPYDWRLPARSPGVLERRNQRKSALILENQRRSQVAALFLSLAIRSASNALSQHHLAGLLDVWVFGCSNPCAASDARRRSGGNEPKTDPISSAQSDQASNSLRHIPGNMRPALRRPRDAPIAFPLNAGVGQPSCADASHRHAHPCATVPPNVCLRQSDRQSSHTKDPARAVPARVLYVHRPGRLCLVSALPVVWHRRQCFVKYQ